MTERAKAYYGTRAEIYGLESPPILEEENARCILAPGNQDHLSAAKILVGAIHQAIAPVESFLIGGMPGVFEARNQHLGVPELERLRTLPRFPQVHTLRRHATGIIVPKLTKGLAPGDGVYLNALSHEEVKDSLGEAWGHATVRLSDPPRPNEDAAQAYFLTRVVDESLVCTKAVFTLAWQAYFEGMHPIKGGRRWSESLTPRYSSVPLQANEVEQLPPFQPLP